MDKSFTSNSWSDHAKSYEELFGKLTAKWARDALSVAHHRLHPRLMEHKSASDLPFEFLDVGCGPGVLSFEFATKYEAIGVPFHIIATDLADGMLERVSARLHDDNSVYSRFADRVTTIQMDGRKLDKIPDASIDAIGSNFGLSIFPERTTGWASAHRVLRDDGLLIVTAWHPSSVNLEWFNAVISLNNGFREKAGEPLMPLLSSVVGSDPVLDDLAAAGFRDIETYQTTHTHAEDFDAVVNGVLDNPMVSALLKHLSKEEVAKVVAKMLCKETDANSIQIEAGGDELSRPTAVFKATAITFVAKK